MWLVRLLLNWKLWVNLLLIIGVVVGIIFYTSKVWLFQRTQQADTVTIPKIGEMKLFEALKTIEKLDLEYELDTVQFFSDYEPHQIIDFYPKGGHKVKKGRKLFIKANPLDYTPVKIPNIKSNTIRLAASRLKIADLQVGDTIYEPDIAKDVVLRFMYNGEEAKEGQVVPRFSQIDVVLGKGLQQNVLVPDLTSMDLSQAKYVIDQNLFVKGNVLYMNPEGGSEIDSLSAKIFYQDPAPNDYYDQGLPISLWLSNYPADSLKSITRPLDKKYRKHLIKDTIERSFIIEEFIPEQEFDEIEFN